MSEDDRAAKAARAKAMLKKRQQQKKVEVAPSPSSPASSRAFSPAPPEPAEEKQHELGDIFTKEDPLDTSWLNSLQPASSSPSTANPDTNSSDEIRLLKSEKASLSKQLEETSAITRQHKDAFEQERQRSQLLSQQVSQLQDEKHQQQLTGQQTIALLVSEKASLTSQLERLESIESNAQTTESLLVDERSKSNALEDHVRRLKAEVLEASKQNQELLKKQKEEGDRSREQERDLQLTNGLVSSLRKEVESSQRRVRELEEHIEGDDRVEQLERALKNSQDRADELEFQLSKLRQIHTTLKSERDELDQRLSSLRASEEEWKTKHQRITEAHSTLQEQVASTAQEKDAILQQKNLLQTRVESAEQQIVLLKAKLTEAASGLADNARHLQAAQAEMKLATRRADDAERIQKDLQVEGTDLMRSLEEMRPKIVELTGIKLELGEKVEGLERELRTRDNVIATLESTVADLRHQHSEAEQEWQAKTAQQEKERNLSQANSTELQDAYNELQEELNSAMSSIRTLEAERSNYHQEATRRIQEIESLTASSTAQMAELAALRTEVDERTWAQDEEKDFLEQAQNEIETLRLEVSARDTELEHLREVVSSPSRSNAPRSLDDEMLSSMKQQHTLELSALQSQIRTLETSLFNAEAHGHAMQKELTALQDKWTQRSFSPGSHQSRPSSRNDLRRSLKGSNASLSRSLLDQKLSPEARHKRKVSLSMLKARIESESVARVSSRPPSRALSPLHEPPEGRLVHFHRPQFLDESHVFWCHSCRGDLVVL